MDLEEKKQGSNVFLSLPNKIRKSCNNTSAKDLNKDKDFDLLTRHKKLYAEGINALAFMAYDKLESFRRSDDTILF